MTGDRFRGKAHNAFLDLQIFLIDVFLLGAGLMLIAQLFVVGGAVAVAIAGARFNRRLRRSRAISAVYFILVLLTLDTTIMISAMAVFSTRPVYFFVPPAVYFIVLALRGRKGLFYYLSPAQLLVVPIFLYALPITPSSFSPEKCAEAARAPGVRLLLPPEPHSIPVFIIDRPDAGDVIAGYKLEPNGPYFNVTGKRASISRVDRKTGARADWLDMGITLALGEDPENGDIYSVIGKTDTPAMKKMPRMQLIRFSPAGKIINSIDLKLPRSSYSRANIIFRGGSIIVAAESDWILYDKRKNGIEPVKIKGLSRPAPLYYSAVSGDTLITTFSSGYFLVSLLTGRRNLVSIDLAEMEFRKSKSGPAAGYFDVKNIPGTRQFIVGQNWTKGGYVVDGNLNVIKEVNIPAGVRNFDISRDGKTVYAGGFFDGFLHAIDMETNREEWKIYAGPESRGALCAKDGRVLAGSKCGLLEVDPSAVRRRTVFHNN